ncbi:DUF2523 family protein [Nitrosomonas sp.]|uniref:DUF2523 family protein n=1 Tax=Nitrosomonas sp. TaxID=42353 RepID=UPI001D99CF7E|nr:hypothetical protein [Nitrosomonas sp.]MCB1947585.1 DUF2523 domain-containing protein [Nitrosomonas sp.]MDR4513155.1 hypothetical protein [Nitrosomonas sp.]
MLAPFITPILNGIRWLALAALPFMLSSFVVGLLIKIGVGITSWYVILYTAELLRDMAIAQLGEISAGPIGGSVISLLGLFGIFEGLSLIVSVLLAKATWLSIRPSLTWLTPPTQ